MPRDRCSRTRKLPSEDVLLTTVDRLRHAVSLSEDGQGAGTVVVGGGLGDSSRAHGGLTAGFLEAVFERLFKRGAWLCVAAGLRRRRVSGPAPENHHCYQGAENHSDDKDAGDGTEFPGISGGGNCGWNLGWLILPAAPMAELRIVRLSRSAFAGPGHGFSIRGNSRIFARRRHVPDR